MKPFRWTHNRSVAAIELSQGATREEAATKAGVSLRAVYKWLKRAEFAEEVDRLSFMTGVAQRAERLRLAKRVITNLGTNTEKDLLDWLRYVQSETDGAKLDLTGLLAAVTDDDSPMA